MIFFLFNFGVWQLWNQEKIIQTIWIIIAFCILPFAILFIIGTSVTQEQLMNIDTVLLGRLGLEGLIVIIILITFILPVSIEDRKKH